RTVENMRYPERNTSTGQLEKGLVVETINKILIPLILKDKKEEVVKVVKEALKNTDYRYDVDFQSVAEPQFY
ncbi:hypothetical protein, partial [Streptococcus sp. DD11]|uniref:hypothetical protein n=1 Tax=Streptococcus sp. DD11 TaxID=1777879 RepID=UPI000A83515F